MSDEVERITLRLPKEIRSKLEKEAVRRGISLNSIICSILFNYFELG